MLKLPLLIILLLVLLALRFHSFYESHPTLKAGQKVSIEATLGEEPELTNKGQSFSIKADTNQIIFIKSTTSPRFHYGQKLLISGQLEEKKIEKDRSLLLIYFPKVEIVREPVDILTASSLQVRKRSKELFEGTLPPTSASLMSGIVFGAKEHFSTDFKQSLRSTGVMHVIAASGMNVTFIAAALLYLLGAFLKRQIALLAAILGIIFYVFLVGFEPSIVRAAVMGVIAFSASIFGRQNLALFSLGLAGLAMLFWQPIFLQDVGFQLSFLATLGILFIPTVGQGAGLVKRLFSETVGTTFAAQIATLPILLGVFGSFGILSLLVNALVLWTVPILMTIGSLSVLIMFIFEPLAKLLLLLALPFLLFFEAVVGFFGRLGWNFTMESFPWQMGAGYYLVLAALVLGFRRHKDRHV